MKNRFFGGMLAAGAFCCASHAWAGNETVTLRATNQTGQTAEQTFTLTVSEGAHSEWIYLPASSVSGKSVPAFAVMKYEAAGNPAAPAAGGVSEAYTWANCRAACQANGAGYDMLTESQWNRIAHDMLAQANNWTGAAAGSGKLFNGIAAASASSTDDGSGYLGASGTSQFERRTMVLSTDDVMWDFAGGRGEWTYADDGRIGAVSGQVRVNDGASGQLTHACATCYTGLSVSGYDTTQYWATVTQDQNSTSYPATNTDLKPGSSYTQASHNVGQLTQRARPTNTMAYPFRGIGGIFALTANAELTSASTAGCRCVLNNPPGPMQANPQQMP